MTPRAIRAQTRVLGLALLLALASGDSRAGDLYRWVTKDGRVEIGTTPPAGVKVEPWSPGEEAIANPTPPPAPEATPPPSTDHALPGDAANHADHPRGRLEERCSTDQAALEKATQKIRVLESQIARMQRNLDELEANETAFSQTSCRTQGTEIAGSDCTTSSFHRDAEIARTQQEIEEAQQKVADLEQRARSFQPRPECTPAAPQQ